ncbi:MAG: response regulator [Edaphocola sp.]
MQKVLVVDDDPYILLSIEFLMRKSGYEVMVARNGIEAMEIINSNKPALVLLDIMMPDVDGYSICRTIKTTPRLQDIIVVFLSAKTAEDDIRRGLDLGAAMYIGKPFSTRELMKKVKELLPAG